MTIGDRIKRRRIKLGYSQDDLARLLGYKSRSSINKIETGIHNISQSKIVAFADKLETTPLFLLGLEDEEGKDITGNNNHTIPLYGNIACGAPILADDNIEDMVRIPSGVKADFALTCKGDSMVNAGICDGDIVYIRKQPIVEDGEIAAVLIEDEATLKRVKFIKPGNINGGIILWPENPAYTPIILDDEYASVQILGKFIALLRIYEGE